MYENTCNGVVFFGVKGHETPARRARTGAETGPEAFNNLFFVGVDGDYGTKILSFNLKFCFFILGVDLLF